MCKTTTINDRLNIYCNLLQILNSSLCFLWNNDYIYKVHFTDRLRELIKGIVHPKMKILSSFTHPQVVPNLYECLCSAEHKGRYSEECGKQSSSGAPLTSIVFFFLLEQRQNKVFVLVGNGRTKTFIQVWNYLWVSK